MASGGTSSGPGAKQADQLDTWHAARLIPTTGIGGQDEQEQRATSSLLAVMAAVPEFGRAILRHAEAPAGRIRSYTEINLKDEDGKSLRPDGAIVVERGKTMWRALVEVKTGAAELRADQISGYMDLARLHGFDAVLTISNQITGSSHESPVQIDARKLRRTPLRHLSWWQILTEAILQKQHRGVSDPDQAWILGELIAYLVHDRSGAGGFDDMGERWVGVRDAARQRTLRANDAGAKDVARRWEQFVQYLSLLMRQELGRDVTAVWSKKLDGPARSDQIVRGLADDGRLTGAIRVPDAAADMGLEVDLRARQVITSIAVVAPREGRAKTRITWLLRQLENAPDGARIEASFPNTRETTSELLRTLRENPDRLLLKADVRREPKAFVVALSREMGSKRGKVAGSFVDATRSQTLEFYRQIVQQVRTWAPAAPKLPAEKVAIPEDKPVSIPPAGEALPVED